MPGQDSQTADSPRFSKPVEVEEIIDLYFHRPTAQWAVHWLAKTPITPNQVTVLAGALGVLSGILLWYGAASPILRLGAAGLLLLSVILDCADGQLARFKNISSTTGAILDGVADYFVGVAVFIGLTYTAVQTSGESWVWWLGAVAGASTIAQCALYDQVKLRYIRNAAISFQEREEDLDQVAYARMRARQQGDFKTLLLLWVYDKYTRAQRAALSEPVAADPEVFRRENRAQMRAWTTIGNGTHLFFLYTAMALSYWWPWALVACLFLFATVMNLIFFPLLFLDRRRRR